MWRSGSSRALSVLLGICITACFHFAGGGLPQNVKTVAVLPFENETPSPTLQQEIYTQMRRQVQSRLGLRDAPEGKADAIVRGRITRYDVDIPVAYSANPSQANTARRKLQITLDVEIVDQTNGKTLWQQKGLIGEGEYAERAEETGRRTAIDKIVNDVINGAQSQW